MKPKRIIPSNGQVVSNVENLRCSLVHLYGADTFSHNTFNPASTKNSHQLNVERMKRNRMNGALSRYVRCMCLVQQQANAFDSRSYLQQNVS